MGDKSGYLYTNHYSFSIAYLLENVNNSAKIGISGSIFAKKSQKTQIRRGYL